MAHERIPQEVSMLPVIRALTEAENQTSRFAAQLMEGFGLTPSQFDVIVTLGDTDGMTCKEVGEQALITKGTLTPVLDRLEGKGLVKRRKGEEDSRQIIVSLTPEGQALYEKVFMPFVSTMRERLAVLSDDEQVQLVALLRKLKSAF